jgi:hypothetical protein
MVASAAALCPPSSVVPPHGHAVGDTGVNGTATGRGYMVS